MRIAPISGLSLCMKIPQFDNTQIAFRHDSTGDLKKSAFLFKAMASPMLTKIGMSLTSMALRFHLPVKGLIKATLFKQFCGGETLAEAAATAQQLAGYNMGVALDYGVEGAEGEQAFDNAVVAFVAAVQYAATQPNIPFIALKVTGFAHFALLEKVHAGGLLTKEEDDEFQRSSDRVLTVCAAAEAANIHVLIDAEETWIQKPIDLIVNRAMAKHNTHSPIVYNTFQMYTHARLEFLRQSIAEAEKGGYMLGAKLVRGACMEKERARALAGNYESPIQPDKESTDRDYDTAVELCMKHLDKVGLFVGTHNEKSCLLAAKLAIEGHQEANNNHLWFSQLYGMSDNISFNLADAGFQVVKYLPYGPVEDVMPYLMRRAQENTSVAGQTSRELSLIQQELDRRQAAKKSPVTA